MLKTTRKKFCGRLLPLALSLVLPSVRGWAAEFKLLQRPFNLTEINEGVSELTPEAGIPVSWENPENYAAGVLHFQLAIPEKPSEVLNYFRLCAVQGGASACTEPYPVRTGGTYQWTQAVAEWQGVGQVDWSEGVMFEWRLSDCNQTAVSPQTDTWCGSPLIGLYYPVAGELTVFVTSEGSEFSGWDNSPILSRFSGEENKFWQIEKLAGHRLRLTLYEFPEATVQAFSTSGKQLLSSLTPTAPGVWILDMVYPVPHMVWVTIALRNKEMRAIPVFLERGFF